MIEIEVYESVPSKPTISFNYKILGEKQRKPKTCILDGSLEMNNRSKAPLNDRIDHICSIINKEMPHLVILSGITKIQRGKTWEQYMDEIQTCCPFFELFAAPSNSDIAQFQSENGATVMFRRKDEHL